MDKLDKIVERIHESMEARTEAREKALAQARKLTRHCANAIRATHRDELSSAQKHLSEARSLADTLHQDLAAFPEIYYAGYTQDALKEYAEANITYALINDEYLPTPEELNIPHETYLRGLAEAAGELRRRCLDLMRTGNTSDAEQLLQYMDDIYAVLVTFDYPDAITKGLRRLTDIVRGVTEKTRGDLTLSLKQEKLEKKLNTLEAFLNSPNDD